MAYPSLADIELQFYEDFFIRRNLEPYPVQEQAFTRIFAGESVLVTVPTGTGKTMMAKAGLYRALRLGQSAVYTTPLRALTEEKYRELCDDFGEDNVGFATGDYKVNPKAKIQVVVAEILWNRIFGDHDVRPADVVIMDEGHYLNSPDRGYVWEQSIIGLDPRSQLIILSATIGNPQQFCQWVSLTRRVQMTLIESHERKVPLYHEYRENYLIEVVRDLFHTGDYPAIIFVFGRELCFETARLLKSCRRFTTEEEGVQIAELAKGVLLDRGMAKDLRPLLLHGIGVHHAGVLPSYKRLVEELTLQRLVKFVVSTETISAGINLPAKRVIFPSLRKVIKGKHRLLLSEEYHQMAGRAGRPQFDSEGIAITLGPEEVVQEVRKEVKEAQKGRYTVDEARIRKAVYLRHKADTLRGGSISWDPETHTKLVQGKPAPLRSKTFISADQILAIGLPDLSKDKPPPAAGETAGQAAGETTGVAAGGTTGQMAGEKAGGTTGDKAGEAAGPGPDAQAASHPDLPPSMNLNIRTVVDHLFVDERTRQAAHKRMDWLVENLQSLGILDEHGQHIAGQMIRQLRGVDGPFVYYCLKNHDLDYLGMRELCEYLVEHEAIQKQLSRKDDDKKRAWMRERLRERRKEEPQVSWEDVEAEYEKEFPRELGPIEVIHQAFTATLPHPELHGGKVRKTIWATIEDEELGFMDFVERHDLENEEGSLFTYLARVMKTARMLAEATQMDEFKALETAIRKKLGAVDERVIEELWSG